MSTFPCEIFSHKDVVQYKSTYVVQGKNFVKNVLVKKGGYHFSLMS
jgi:hypothetical protein